MVSRFPSDGRRPNNHRPVQDNKAERTKFWSPTSFDRASKKIVELAIRLLGLAQTGVAEDYTRDTPYFRLLWANREMIFRVAQKPKLGSRRFRCASSAHEQDRFCAFASPIRKARRLNDCTTTLSVSDGIDEKSRNRNRLPISTASDRAIMSCMDFGLPDCGSEA